MSERERESSRAKMFSSLTNFPKSDQTSKLIEYLFGLAKNFSAPPYIYTASHSISHFLFFLIFRKLTTGNIFTCINYSE